MAAEDAAEMIHLEGEELRAELRASINTFGSDQDRANWRTCNNAAKTVGDRNPLMDAGSVANRILEQWPSVVALATELATPRGATAVDIILEQAEFWGAKTLPDDPWMGFGWLYFGRGWELKDAADFAGLERNRATAIAHTFGDHYSYREIESKTGIARSSVGNYLRLFFTAMLTAECPCESPHCSLNDPDARKRLVAMLKADLKARQRSGGVSKAPSPKGARGVSKGRGADPYGTRPERGYGASSAHTGALGTAAERGYGVHNTPVERGSGASGAAAEHGYAETVVNDTMPIHVHRLVWTRKHGPIPWEHDLHHVDGEIYNNAIGNLALLPRWIHRICH